MNAFEIQFGGNKCQDLFRYKLQGKENEIIKITEL